MTVFKAVIRKLVGGDDIEVKRTITSVPVGSTITKAWLTIKVAEGDADPGLLQKVITSVFVAGKGQITDDGAGDQTAVLFFEIVPADATPIGIGVIRVYDIQVKTSTGKIYTAEKGSIELIQGITDAVT